MKITSKMSFFAALAYAVLAPMAANAVVYNREVTNQWFNVVAATTDLVTPDSHWTKPHDGEAAVVDSLINISTELNDPLVYTPTGSGTAVQSLFARVVVSAYVADPTTEGFGNAQGAVAAVKGDGDVIDFVGLVKGPSGPVWQHFTAVHPLADEVWDVLIEFDNHTTTKKVRFLAKRVDADKYTALHDGWLDSINQSATTVSSVAFAGEGKFGDFSCNNISAFAAAEYDGVVYGSMDEAIAAGEADGWTKSIRLRAECDSPLAIADGKTVRVDPNGFDFVGKVTGFGRLVIVGDGTDKQLPKIAGLRDNNTWRGTVEVCNWKCTTQTYMRDYGNAFSKFCANGFEINVEAGTSEPMNLEIGEGGLKMIGQHSESYYMFTGLLSGSGRIEIAVTSEVDDPSMLSNYVRFSNVNSTFSGELVSSGDYRICIMNTNVLYPPTLGRGAIFISAGYSYSIAAGKTWSANGHGIVVNGTLRMEGTTAETIAGTGVVVYDLNGKAAVPTMFTGVNDSDNWKGTVLMENMTESVTTGSEAWGNVNSTVKIIGTDDNKAKTAFNAATIANAGTIVLENATWNVPADTTYSGNLVAKTGADVDGAGVLTLAGTLTLNAQITTAAAKLAFGAGSTVVFQNDDILPMTVNTPSTLALPSSGVVNIDISGITADVPDIQLLGGTALQPNTGVQLNVIDTQSRGRMAKVMYSSGAWWLYAGYPEAQIGDVKYGTLTGAFASVKEGETIKMLLDINLPSSTLTPTLANNAYLDCGDFLFDCALDIQGGKTLTIVDGHVVMHANSGANVIKLAGGRYESRDAVVTGVQVETGYQYVKLYIPETHTGTDHEFLYQLVKSGKTLIDTEEAITVSDTQDGNYPIIIDTEWIGQKMSVVGGDKQSVVDWLNGPGYNGILVWQSYVLHVDPLTGSSRPVIQNIPSSNPAKVTFSLGGTGFDPSLLSDDVGVVTKYRVNTMASPKASEPEASSAYVRATETTELALPESGASAKYYQVEIEFTPQTYKTPSSN